MSGDDTLSSHEKSLTLELFCVRLAMSTTEKGIRNIETMQNAMWITTIVLLLGNLGFLVFILKRLAAKDKTQDELLALRELVANLEKAIRDEVRASQETTANTLTVQLESTANTLVRTVGQLREAQSDQLGSVVESINNLTKTNEEKLQTVQTSNETKLEQIRRSVNEQLKATVDTLTSTVGELGEAQTRQLETVKNSVDSTAKTLVNTVAELGQTQTRQLEAVRRTIDGLTQANETSIENVRNTLTTGLKDLQTSNENKLEQMRQTVDEQLQSTLERRIGESFKLVSTHLEAVQQGLGEMQNLATGVGDLKKVLTNVRARGTWGEVQLGALLEQILTPDQYDTNVRIKEHSQEVVEFAIRLPGSEDEPGSCLWLPIDSKFPVADYQRLIEASDAETERTVTRDFIRVVETEAKKIRDKYIAPPKTTDFAIMFLPTEGLYAEVLRQPGQVEKLQTKYRIIVAGPTTLTAILSSLRMGFKTLAIQKRSSEVWEVLAAVKTEFDKFGEVMTKLKRQLNTAAKTVEQTSVRTRAMERNLRAVEKLPPEVSTARLGFTLEEHTINEDNADDS